MFTDKKTELVFQEAQKGKIKEAVDYFKKNEPRKEEERLAAYFLNCRFKEAFLLAERISSKPISPLGLTVLRNPWLYDFVRNENYEKAYLFLKSVYEKLKRTKFSGNLNFLKNHYKAALSFYIPKEAQENFPDKYPENFFWGLNQRGKFFLHTGYFSKAENDFKKALKYDKKDWESACLLAETLILAGKENIGFSIFEKAKKNCQDERERSQIEIWKAEMLLMAGKTKETIEILKKYSGNPFSKCWEGAALSMEGEFKKAEKKLKDAEKANPKDYEAVFWLIETLIKANKKKEAEKKLKKIEYLRLTFPFEKNLWPALVLKSLIEEKKGNIKKARETLQELNNYFPGIKFPKKAEDILKKAKGCRRGEYYLIKGLFGQIVKS